MGRKISIIVNLMLCIVGLSACSSGTKYSEEETTVIADYVAQTVLKHSEGYEHKLVDLADNPFEVVEEDYVDDLINDEIKDAKADDESVEIDKKEALAKEGEEQSQEGSNEDINNNFKVELSDILGFGEGVDVTISKHKELMEYSANAYVIDIDSDEKLVELTIDIKNTTDKEVQLATPTSGIKYKLVTNTEEYYPLLTAIENDLVYFEKNVKAGKTESAVLIYKVPKNTDMSSLTFAIINNGEEAEVSLN